MMHRDLGAFAQDHRALDDIAKLPDIASDSRTSSRSTRFEPVIHNLGENEWRGLTQRFGVAA
jgi:hypothetical protein